MTTIQSKDLSEKTLFKVSSRSREDNKRLRIEEMKMGRIKVS
jgi:hypothetical protein